MFWLFVHEKAFECWHLVQNPQEKSIGEKECRELWKLKQTLMVPQMGKGTSPFCNEILISKEHISCVGMWYVVCGGCLAEQFGRGMGRSGQSNK